MFTGLTILGVSSFLVLVIIAAVVARSFWRSRDRRRTATPLGILYGPTDAELRRTRDMHPEHLEIVGAWKEDCLACGGAGSLPVGEGKVVICWRCEGQGDILITEKERENGGKTSE